MLENRNKYNSESLPELPRKAENIIIGVVKMNIASVGYFFK